MSSSVESVVSRSGENPSSEISEMAPCETAQSSSGVLSSLYLFRERSNWTDFLFLDMVCGCGEGNCSLCSGSLWLTFGVLVKSSWALVVKGFTRVVKDASGSSIMMSYSSVSNFLFWSFSWLRLC